jgi:hypothetical protein
MLIPLVVSKLCPGQEKGTDGQGGDYMLPRNFFGEHKNCKLSETAVLESSIDQLVSMPSTQTMKFEAKQLKTQK